MMRFHLITIGNPTFFVRAASVFREQRKLEPMPPERKARWRKEVYWFLSVTDHIVQFVPSQQVSKDGTNMEVKPLTLPLMAWQNR